MTGASSKYVLNSSRLIVADIKTSFKSDLREKYRKYIYSHLYQQQFSYIFTSNEPLLDETLEDAEQEVGVEMSLVHFVDHDDVVLTQHRV